MRLLVDRGAYSGGESPFRRIGEAEPSSSSGTFGLATVQSLLPTSRVAATHGGVEVPPYHFPAETKNSRATYGR